MQRLSVFSQAVGISVGWSFTAQSNPEYNQPNGKLQKQQDFIDAADLMKECENGKILFRVYGLGFIA